MIVSRLSEIATMLPRRCSKRRVNWVLFITAWPFLFVSSRRSIVKTFIYQPIQPTCAVPNGCECGGPFSHSLGGDRLSKSFCCVAFRTLYESLSCIEVGWLISLNVLLTCIDDLLFLRNWSSLSHIMACSLSRLGSLWMACQAWEPFTQRFHVIVQRYNFMRENIAAWWSQSLTQELLRQ